MKNKLSNIYLYLLFIGITMLILYVCFHEFLGTFFMLFWIIPFMISITKYIRSTINK